MKDYEHLYNKLDIEQQKIEGKYNRASKKIKNLFLFFVLLSVSVGILRAYLPSLQTIYPSKVAIFNWPKGCIEKKYSKLDGVSKNCLNTQYGISKSESEKIGLSISLIGWSNRYQRLGNDAVFVECREQDCFVKIIYHNAFYQD